MSFKSKWFRVKKTLWTTKVAGVIFIFNRKLFRCSINSNGRFRQNAADKVRVENFVSAPPPLRIYQIWGNFWNNSQRCRVTLLCYSSTGSFYCRFCMTLQNNPMQLIEYENTVRDRKTLPALITLNQLFILEPLGSFQLWKFVDWPQIFDPIKTNFSIIFATKIGAPIISLLLSEPLGRP